MTAVQEQSTIDLSRYAAVLRSRWRIIVATTVVGVLGAVAYTLLVPTTYVASSTVSVVPITTEPFSSGRANANLVDMSAEAVAASSSRVAETAAATAQGWDTIALRDSTEVTVGADSATMTISVSASSEQRARLGASAVAEAYLEVRSAQAEASIESAAARNRAQIDELRTELTAAIERSAAAEAGSAAEAEAEADRQILDLQIASVLARSSSLEGVDTTGGVILNPADLAPVSVEPSRQIVLASGAALGLGLGVVIAFTTPLLLRRVRGERDVRRDLDTVVLGGWSDADTADTDLQATAQRVLRAATVAGSTSVAVIFDALVPWPNALLDRLAIQTPELDFRAVDPEATEAERLQALRQCDASLLVAVRDLTRSRVLGERMDESQLMGAPTLGVLLVPDVALEADLVATDEQSAATRRPSTRRASDAARESAAASRTF